MQNFSWLNDRSFRYQDSCTLSHLASTDLGEMMLFILKVKQSQIRTDILIKNIISMTDAGFKTGLNSRDAILSPRRKLAPELL